MKTEIQQPGGITANIEIEVRSLTKGECEKSLANKADLQRNLKTWRQKQLASDLTENKWWFTGAAIVYNQDGRLIDGQHRIGEWLRAGIFPQTVIVRGVRDEAYLSIDNITPKTLADHFKYLGIKNANSAAAIALLITRYEESTTDNLKSASVIPRSRIEETFFRNQDQIQDAIKKSSELRSFIAHSVAASSYVLIAQSFGEEFTDSFFHGIATGIHKHNAVRSIHDAIRKDNIKPKKQFGPDPRFLSILLSAHRAFYESSLARVWPNTTKVTKPLTK